MNDSNARIRLRVSNQKAYVWDVDDIATLRSKHHICGVLTGTLPHLSQQNVFLGVPLLLLPEEVVLLIEKELAVLVDDPSAHHAPSPSEIAKWNAERQRSVQEQAALAGAKEAKEAGRGMTEAAIQKRKEREEKRARAKAQAESSLLPQDTPIELTPTLPPPRPSTPSTSTPSPSFTYTLPIPASSSGYAWYDPGHDTYTTIAAAQSAGVWAYPATLYERARCAVFRDLWERGYFLGVGIKFGGDFLVYPGDPLRYHSHFVATVIESPVAALRPMEIVAHGRLGTATKKAHLLCGWDDEKKEVSHLSIEWAGFG
ncbi:tRNA-intron endonuclease catalytic domain-like protein [Gloeophyllum trabeum ATCC 11539]|uniref:tRNA-splicing endonuclease subunit Sen34 n=1 Tax=Gloeophyllum trabeum (strain ATCC 11539 / FP-39264 / Madison 617) TaxID=670483 RepID=S7QE61_GLOTA|nr:tRNA-intron endonuclease catalytic domain-like protein [Gloeophyllum trabeum ATCC 11539]EPQ58091.1 tRNA-intron endonuclease catalytic domain-like protein [Gloeophyllum trabeum ATCC 11539]